jgi:hypothetical protein
MKDDPEEEHFVVDEYEDGFTAFHDTKNSQHGCLHPTGTFFIVNKDGSIWALSVKKYTFHNAESDLFLEADSDTGDIILRTKGNINETVGKDVVRTINKNNILIIGENKTENVSGNTSESTSLDRNISVGGNLTIDVGGDLDMKASGDISINGNIIRLN